MTRFYDAKDDKDLARVEAVLKKGGIEYFVAAKPAGVEAIKEIEVAEEDVAKAEDLLLEATGQGGRKQP